MPRNGKFRTYYGDGSLQCVQSYKNGQRNGVWICYYPSGGRFKIAKRSIQSIDTYRNGLMHGPSVVLNEKGDTLESGEYYENRKIGSWRYFYSNGSILSIQHLDSLSTPIGEQIRYSYPMRVTMREFYTAPREGIVEYYDDTARIISRYGVKNGLQHGTTCLYHYTPGTSDTFYREVSAWHMGNRHGWTIKYEGKVVVAKTYYMFGLKNDVAYTYDSKTGVEIFSPYTNDVLTGKQVERHNGNLYRETEYSGGVKNGEEWIYNSAGGLVSEYNYFTKGNADTTEYVRYPLLIWYTRAKVDAQKNEYKVVYRYSDTQDSLVYFERNGIRTGKQVKYFPNGVVKEEMFWKDGVTDSMYIQWNERGRIILRAKPCFGRDTVPEEVWDDNGVRLKPGTPLYEARVKNLHEYIQRYDRNSRVVYPILIFRKDRSDIGEETVVYGAEEPCWNKPGNVPSFQGGEEARLKYFKSQLRYPELEFESDITGSVYVEFIVTAEGKLDSVKVVKDAVGAPNFSKIVVRAITSMPPWIPEMQNGKAVSRRCVIGVKFELYGNYRPLRRDY